MKRIHIIGCSPRSGTTLMTELLIAGFHIDGHDAHEFSVLKRPGRHFQIFCSKRPRDTLYVRPVLGLEKNLWVIYMMRDPRDVVVSKHKQDPTRYWSNLRIWKHYHHAARKILCHPRVLTVRYEDLVDRPDEIQDWLMGNMPFLKKRSRFSEFPHGAWPSGESIEALGGLRPITTGSIGKWRQHKPRLLAQIALHGPITEELIQLGYETDDRWLRELENVVPDNHTSRWPEHQLRITRMLIYCKNHFLMFRHFAGALRRFSIHQGD